MFNHMLNTKTTVFKIKKKIFSYGYFKFLIGIISLTPAYLSCQKIDGTRLKSKAEFKKVTVKKLQLISVLKSALKCNRTNFIVSS